MENMEYLDPEMDRKYILGNLKFMRRTIFEVVENLEQLEYELTEGVLTYEEELLVFEFRDKLLYVLYDLAVRMACLENLEKNLDIEDF